MTVASLTTNLTARFAGIDLSGFGDHIMRKLAHWSLGTGDRAVLLRMEERDLKDIGLTSGDVYRMTNNGPSRD